MDELRSILSEYSFEPWNRFTAGLIAALFVARGLDFLSTWIVTPTLKLEANPLMRRVRWGWMTVTILTKSRICRSSGFRSCSRPRRSSAHCRNERVDSLVARELERLTLNQVAVGSSPTRLKIGRASGRERV